MISTLLTKSLSFDSCRLNFASVAGLILLALSSCEAFLDVEPPKSQLVGESVFTDDLTARSATAGMYYTLGSSGFAGGSTTSVTYLGGLLADDSRYAGNAIEYIQFNTNNVVPSNAQVAALWSNLYSMVYYCNLLLEKLHAAETLSPGLRNNLLGEAYFVRAFAYFYLVNLFGEVPLATGTDYRTNNILSRAPEADIYSRILLDLEQAAELLPQDYTGGERVTPVQATATAMMARVQLYLRNYEAAAALASSVIGSSLYELEEPGAVFLKNSTEAIWQLIPSNRTENNFTMEGGLFIVVDRPEGQVLREAWVESVWEEGDLRFETWVGLAEGEFGRAYYSFKYKENAANATGAEYSMVLRLAEMYLVRAEARAETGDLEGAAADLNVVRARAGLEPLITGTREELLDAAFSERRLEYFAEWGHRWFDLKRTGRMTEVLSAVKDGWTGTDSLLPIPETELLLNGKLAQNPGY